MTVVAPKCPACGWRFEEADHEGICLRMNDEQVESLRFLDAITPTKPWDRRADGTVVVTTNTRTWGVSEPFVLIFPDGTMEVV